MSRSAVHSIYGADYRKSKVVQKIAPGYENMSTKDRHWAWCHVISLQKGANKGERDPCRDPLTVRYDARNWTPIPIWLLGETGLDLIRFNPASGCPNFAAFMQIRRTPGTVFLNPVASPSSAPSHSDSVGCFQIKREPGLRDYRYPDLLFFISEYETIK